MSNSAVLSASNMPLSVMSVNCLWAAANSSGRERANSLILPSSVIVCSFLFSHFFSATDRRPIFHTKSLVPVNGPKCWKKLECILLVYCNEMYPTDAGPLL